MKTFKEFVEAKECKDKIRLASDIGGEPVIVGGKKPKKGIKMTLDIEGEPKLVRNAKK